MDADMVWWLSGWICTLYLKSVQGRRVMRGGVAQEGPIVAI